MLDREAAPAVPKDLDRVDAHLVDQYWQRCGQLIRLLGMALRALGVARLSVVRGQAQTGLPRQRQDIEAKARELGAELINIAEDKSVSAFKVPPLKRPRLAEWLNRTDEYEILIYWKQDRFVRRLIPDFTDMISWATEHKIRMVSATESFGDPTLHAEQIIPIVHAWLGQGESEAESQRMTSTKRYLREAGRWPGGLVPFGYRPEQLPGGKGWVLRIDPESANIVREAVARVIGGESLFSVTADFNRRGLPTPRDYQRIQAGKPTGKPKRDASGAVVTGLDGEPEREPVSWQTSSLLVILRSEALIGRVRHFGKTVRGADGRVVVRAEPLISVDDWERLQAVLSDPARHRRAKRRVNDPALLLRVVDCVICHRPVYRWVHARSSGKTYTYYRCRTGFNRAEYRQDCPAMPVHAEWLEELAADLFLSQVGDVELLERHLVPGDTYAAELEEVGKAIAELTADRYVRGIVRDDYDAVVGALQAEHARLAELPSLPPRTEYRSTGKTYRQLWKETADAEPRRRLMTGAGFRLEVARLASGTVVVHHLDPDLARRAGLAASGQRVELPPDVHLRDHPWSTDKTARSIGRLASTGKGSPVLVAVEQLQEGQ